jgi:predicted MFS family arabinose efflux permease
VREFRALWAAQLMSVLGDQLARVALTVLVYDRTRSSALAAITFVSSIIPTFIGGIALAWLADRFPRRTVMIVCDLARCMLVLLMALPGASLGVLVTLLFVVTLIGAPFSAARAAIYPEVLPGERYVVGTAVTLTTNQFAQVVGFALGGSAVGFLGIRVSLILDAATFAASMLIVRCWVQSRPAEHRSVTERRPPGRFKLDTARLVFGRPALRIPLLFGWLAAFYNSPEGVAAPLAGSMGGGAVAVGMLLAALAFGETAGTIVFSRFVTPMVRRRLSGPLAMAACAALVLFAVRPPLAGALLILVMSGAFGCYQVEANAAFVRAVPSAQRSQAFGLAQGGMSLGQGGIMVLAGALAERVAPADVIAIIGAVGAAVAAVIFLARPRLDLADDGRDGPVLAPGRGAHGAGSSRWCELRCGGLLLNPRRWCAWRGLLSSGVDSGPWLDYPQLVVRITQAPFG